jgi:outer membrane protein assembly factor BamA
LFTFLTHISQGLLDSLGQDLVSSTFTLSSNLGALDDPANPRRGFVLRPAIQVTAPPALASTNFWRVDASANSFLPLGRVGVFATRVRFGQLFPFGKACPAPPTIPR